MASDGGGAKVKIGAKETEDEHEMQIEVALGETGPQGVQGKIGDQGPQGKLGDTGDQGPQGKIGDTGVQGPQGKLGDTGDQGPQGKLGDTGDQGPQGKIGDTGVQGPQGKLGDTGDQGPQGKIGPAGADGADGAQGVQGKVGPQGDTGPQGPTGAVNSELLDALTQTVFITSAAYVGDLVSDAQASFPDCIGVSDGITAADCICQEVAEGAGLAGTYLAWISDSDVNNDPESRFNQATKPYILPDQSVVAADWADLTDGLLTNPINVTQTGAPAGNPPLVWTNVRTDGTRNSSSSHCSDWTDTGGTPGRIGLHAQVDSRWTNPPNGTNCANDEHLYCFEQ